MARGPRTQAISPRNRRVARSPRSKHLRAPNSRVIQREKSRPREDFLVKSNSLTHLSNQDLTSALAAAAARERISTAELVAYIAEFDARGLYRPAGYPSMHQYCEAVLGLSPDSAYKRIQVARAAREFPQLVEALEDGCVHLTGANLLAPLPE